MNGKHLITHNPCRLFIIIIMSLFVVFLETSKAAERTWSNLSGGYFENSANWVGGNVPGEADVAIFSAAATYPVMLGESVTNHTALFSAPYGKVSLDIGEDNLYFVTLFRLQSSDGNVEVDITSGKLDAYKVYLGDWAQHKGSVLTLKNPGTLVTTRNDDIYVGGSGSDNVFVVSNGASAVSGRVVYAGYQATGNNNSILVSGEESVLGSSRNGNFGLVIGNQGSNNRLIVEDKAQVIMPSAGFSIGETAGSHSNSIYMASGCFMTNGTAHNTQSHVGRKGSYNTMTLSNATLIIDFNLNVGHEGQFNKLNILDGGKVQSRTHLYIGSNASGISNEVHVVGEGSLVRTTQFDVNAGNYGNDNLLRISDGGTVESYRSIYAGTTGDSSGNRIIVEGSNSVLRSLGTSYQTSIAVGQVGTNNSLLVKDGASFVCDSGAFIYVGKNADSVSNSVFIGPDAVATNTGLIYIGYEGDNSSLTVSNSIFYAGGYSYSGYTGSGNNVTICGGSTYTFTGHFHVGYNASACQNTLAVTGGGTVLTNLNYDLDVGFNGASNVMTIEDGAEVFIRRSVYVGHNAGATNNVLRINGGALYSQQNYSGTPSMTVANSGTLSVYGTNSILEAKTLNIIDDSTLDIRFSDETFTPINATGTVTFDETTKLFVNALGCKSEGQKITLLKYGRLEGEILPENITLLPVGTTIDFEDGKSISIKLPRGTLLMVR